MHLDSANLNTPRRATSPPVSGMPVPHTGKNDPSPARPLSPPPHNAPATSPPYSRNKHGDVGDVVEGCGFGADGSLSLSHFSQAYGVLRINSVRPPLGRREKRPKVQPCVWPLASLLCFWPCSSTSPNTQISKPASLKAYLPMYPQLYRSFLLVSQGKSVGPQPWPGLPLIIHIHIEVTASTSPARLWGTFISHTISGSCLHLPNIPPSTTPLCKMLQRLPTHPPPLEEVTNPLASPAGTSVL